MDARPRIHAPLWTSRYHSSWMVCQRQPLFRWASLDERIYPPTKNMHKLGGNMRQPWRQETTIVLQTYQLGPSHCPAALPPLFWSAGSANTWPSDPPCPRVQLSEREAPSWAGWSQFHSVPEISQNHWKSGFGHLSFSSLEKQTKLTTSHNPEGDS